jgi:effector-binding domain-containing protein
MGVVRSDELPKAETILDQWDAAGGDAAARKNMKSLLMKGSIGIPGASYKATFEEAFLGRDRVKFASESSMGRQTQGSNGTISWTTDPAFGVTVKEGEDQASVIRMFAIARRADWRSLYDRAETVQKVDFNGRPHFELRMIPRSGKPDNWLIDCESHLLSRVDLALPEPTGGELPCQFCYSDWKKVDGVLFPYIKRQVIAGMEIVFTYDSIVPNAPVTPEQVAPPPDVQAAIDDASKRTPTAKPGECSLTECKAQPTATIRMTVKANEISKSLAIMLPEVGACLSKASVTPAGPPFARYHEIKGDTIDLEAGIAVATPIKGEGRVHPSELPGGRCVTTWHVGPYTQLPKTHDLLKAWMAAKSLQGDGGFWEIYWSDPGLEPDPSKWKTQIVWPVK